MNTRQLIGTVFDTVLKIVIIIVVVMFTYKYATESYDFGYRIFAEEPVSSTENARIISIGITEEATVMDIGEVLEEKGLINDARLFYVQELISRYHGELKPGIYELSSDMTANEMMEVMSAEDVQQEADSEEESTEETGGPEESVEGESVGEDSVTDAE
ncbi:endolytic transglycosylase MltG [Kineothrix sp. MB12-C1]|uniref:endolytic transglycosylase MltG n=1 Tax=Kineothrix sp. MB12-C1 TaxID=3070215 RepID=UPI0027D2290B|nr:endolytic transglycosylase MltG [Kineothrix sp. MB12-C1]WMC91570.1 aminodeoxychorismate lyase [Kineothrix sp. MB12-C1]